MTLPFAGFPHASMHVHGDLSRKQLTTAVEGGTDSQLINRQMMILHQKMGGRIVPTNNHSFHFTIPLLDVLTNTAVACVCVSA